MSGSKQSLRWVFTLNNYGESDVESILSGVDQCLYRYVIIGREVGAQGTPHLQGYLELSKKKTLGGVKKLQPCFGRAHWEPARGTVSQNIAYCSKDGQSYSRGEPSVGQGMRSDLGALVEDLKNGRDLKDVALENPELYCRYRGGLRDLANWANLSVRKPPRVIYIWGPPGTGKSRYAFSCNEESTWSYPGNGWFDGYKGQAVAIFDDFDDDQSTNGGISIGMFLKLLDRYPVDVPVKGGFVQWRPTKIILTSNRDFESLYRSAHWSQYEAIKRRIKEADRWYFD